MMIEALKLARRAGAPLIHVTTPDQPAAITRIVAGFAGNGTPPPIIGWSPIDGLTGLNSAGREALAKHEAAADDGMPPPSADIVTALVIAAKLDAWSLVVVPHAGRAIGEHLAPVAAVLALRDPFKATNRTLVLITPIGTTLPAELAADMLMIDDPKPTAADLSLLAGELATEYHDVKTPEAEAAAATLIDRAGLSLEGVNRFAAEQAIALSLCEHGSIETADLRGRRRTLIGQVPGLSVDRASGSRANIGGLIGILNYCDGIFTGPDAPRAVIRIEEIEKAIGGFGTDTSGTTTDQVGVLLTAMEDLGWTGFLAAGVAGAGKSLLSKTLAAVYDCEAVTLDLGAAKGSLVGQSEARIREAVATIRALAGARALFVASCNRMAVIPPELKRRFRLGTWFFDLPTAVERLAIWPIHLAAFGLDSTQPRPDDTDWTGADIRNACELAYRLRRPLLDVAGYMVPVAKSDPQAIEQIRNAARGRWISASTGTVYGAADLSTTPAATGRRFQ